MTTAFVLGGGGLLGAHEVGMLRAVTEAGIQPDLVVGTSVGAINGAFLAADPPGAAARLNASRRPVGASRSVSIDPSVRAARALVVGSRV